MDEPMMSPAHASPVRLLGAVVALGLCVGAGGCSSSTSGATGATKDGGASTVDADGDEDAADSGPACSQGCQATSLANATCVASVQASLVDTTGAPIAGQPLLVCGDNLCSLPGVTDGEGATQFSLCEQMVYPALKFIGGPAYASFATAITQENTTFAPVTLFALPATGAAFPTGGGTVTSGPVSLQVAAGAVKFDSSQPNDANTQSFRATQIDVTKLPVPLPSGVTLSVVWGLAPVNATLSTPGALTIPNTEAWTAGAKVDLYQNGVDPIAGVAVAYGQWTSIGTGTVSADGSTITTDTGIAVLSMVGARLHQ